MLIDTMPTTPATYQTQASHLLQTAQTQWAAVAQLDDAETVEAVLGYLNTLALTLEAGHNQASLFRAVHPDSTVRQAASNFEQEFAQLATQISLAPQCYQAVRRLSQNSAALANADAATKRYVQHLLRDLRRAGADQDATRRAQIAALRATLVQLGQQFEGHIRQDVRHVQLPAAALAGLPDDYRASHPADAQGHVRLSTDYPDYLPFMTYAHDDTARRQLYVAFRQRGYPANQTVLSQLLQKRAELAALLGYSSWAAYITADKMLASDTAVSDFIAKIQHLAQPRAQADYAELLAQKGRSEPAAAASSHSIDDWQKAYLEEQVKRRRYNVDAQQVRSYFRLAKVRQGLFDLVSTLFGLRIVPLPQAPVWHPSVQAYAVYQQPAAPQKDDAQSAALLGHFYLDLQPRAEKYKHAAAFPLLTGVGGATPQLPSAALVCNFPAGDDALLEHDAVQTFFHEFGHLLHHLLARAPRWVAQGGIATEWDFVEAPSQMLEEWAFDGPTLATFAQNAAGETLPEPLLAALRRSRDFGKGLWVQQQMFYAALSLQLHQLPAAAPPPDTTALWRQLQQQYSPFAYVPETYPQLSFGHLDGYSALYYTYMWSLVIAKDLFAAFTAQGLHDVATARRYREHILAPGGAQDAAVLIENFLGRPLSFEAFNSWLNAA